MKSFNICTSVCVACAVCMLCCAMCVRMYVCMYVCVLCNVCMYVCMLCNVCMCVCICVLCVYVHTCTSTCNSMQTYSYVNITYIEYGSITSISTNNCSPLKQTKQYLDASSQHHVTTLT